MEMQSYIEWMRGCSDITVTGCPAISVPAGFTPDGLPVGLRVVGRHGADLALLRLAHAFEQATRAGEQHVRWPRSNAAVTQASAARSSAARTSAAVVSASSATNGSPEPG